MAARRNSGLTRAQELEEVGTEVLRARLPGPEATVAAVAAMLAHIEVQGRRKQPKAIDEARLAFSPNTLYAMLREQVPHLVVCVPVQHRLFGQLGGQLKGIAGLEAADAGRVVAWIAAGGLASWSVMPTFAHVVQNIGKFVGYAREWDRRGRQQLGKGKLNVGLPVAEGAESELSEEFR